MVNAAAVPRGVQLYTPTPQTPVARAVAPSKRTTPAKGKTPAPKFDAIDQQFMASPTELAKRQQVQTQEHPPDLPWWQDALGFGANVLSPLTVPGKVVTFGLEQATRHLPTPVRNFLQDPVSYATPDSWEKNPVVDTITNFGDAAFPLINPFFGQDVEKIDKDKRSFFNKIAPRSTYGSEAIYQDVGVPGMTGLRNLTLDIGHDPLTFISGGERVLAKSAELGAELGVATRGAETAATAFDQATEAYAKTLQQSGKTWLSDNLAKITDKAAEDLTTATSRQAAAKAAFEGSAEAVHAPATVGQRASFIAELLGRQPELVQFKDEFAKGISRGFGRMSPEAREAIDMAPRALRFGGKAIPGTAKLVEGSGMLGSGLRAGTGKIGEFLPETLRDFRTPETVAEARKALRSKSTSPEMYQLYSDYIRIVNDVRLGSGEMTQRGAQAVNREWKNTFNKMTEGERDAMRVAAEASPDANKVNDLLVQLADIHEKITGKSFEDFSSINKNQYLPHIQSKEWAAWLKEHPEDPRAVAYKAATDFKTSDMLHTSGFVDRARQLRLRPGETSKEIDIGGRTMRLNGNTLNDLNEGLAKVFPEFEGKFYETDLDKIFHTYSDALARDAGSRRAFRNLAESASPHGRVVEGELADTLDKMNEALTQQSQGARLRKMVEDRGGTFTPGETLSVPERPLVPGSKADQNTLRYWHEYNANVTDAIATQDWQRVDSLVNEASKQKLSRTGMEVLGKDQTTAAGFTNVRLDDGSLIQVPDATIARGGGENIPAEHLSILQPRASDTATKELTQWANSGVPTTFAGQSNIEGRAVRQQMIDAMTDIRKNAYDGLRNEVSASSDRIKSLREVADEYIKKIKGIGKVDRNNAAEVTQLRESMEKNVLDLENEIKARNSVWKGKGTREANKIDKELNAQLRTLKAHSESLDRKMAELPAEIRKEIKWRREQLFKPVEDARSNLKQAESHFKMRDPLTYTPEQITWAQETELAGRKMTGKATATAEQLREDYRAAVTKLEGLRNKLSSGKLTEASAAKVQAQVDKQAEKVGGILEQARQAREAGTDVARTPRPPLPRADRARAQEILANVADYEKRLNDHLAPYQQRLDQAYEQMRRQPEALVYTPTKSARYLHDEAGRFGSMVTPREDIFQGRRVEPVTTPPQQGAFKLDVTGITDPTPGAAPSIHPTAETRAVPRGMEGVKLRKQGVGAAGDVHLGSHSVQLPPQRLEEQALKDLERLANSPQQSSMGRYAANQREAARIAEDTLPTRIANAQAAAAKENEVGRLTDVLPREAARDRAQAAAQKLSDLEPIVHELAQEVDTRGQLRVLRDQYKSLPLGSKKVDIDATIRDLQQFNANNMLLDDATRKATDDLLKDFTTESQRIAGNRDVINGLGKMARDARSGKLKDEYLTGLSDGWRGLHDGPVQRGDFIMDERLRSMLLRAEKTIDDPKLFGRIFNEATNVFKTYATLSPSFHVRNAISGIFMNAADGVSLANQLDGWKMVRQFKKAADSEAWLALQEPEVQEAFRIMGGSGGGGRFAEAGFAGRHDNAALNRLTRNRVTLLSQRAGEQVEQSLRLGMALDSVRSGMNAHNALERISRIHFDYSQLSKLDETMKRIIPFWTFMSRNLPLQMQMIYTMPKMYSAYGHFKQNFSAPDAPFTPSYWQNLGAFNTGGTLGGMPLYLQPDLGIDQAQQQLRQIKDIAGGDWGQLLSQANPLVVGPAQAMFKKDLYRDRNFGPADYSKADGPIGNLIAALARVVPGQTKTVDGQTLVSDNFTNLVTKLIPPLNQAGRLAPQTTGDLGDTSRQAEALARYLGIPIRTLSPKQQEIEARNQFFDARDALATQKSLRRRAAA